MRACAAAATAGFARKATPRPGLVEHGEVVGAVADRDRVLAREPEPLAQLDERGELRLAPEDRLLDAAGELLACDHKPVRAVLVEADPAPRPAR